jgi:hypothetical protein
VSVKDAQTARLRPATTPHDVSLTLASASRAINFGDWNGRPTYLPLILR